MGLDILSQASAATIFATLVPWTVTALLALVLVALRFTRRGPTRHWLGTAFLSLAMLPAIVGVALSARAARERLEFAAGLGGSGGALQAGLLESGLPLVSGLLATAGVSLLAMLVLAFSRSPASRESPAPVAVGPLLAAAAVGGVTAILVVVGLAMASGVEGDAQTGAARANGVFWISVLTAVVVFGGSLAMAVRAPRASAPTGMRWAALGGPLGVAAAACLVATTALVLGQRSMNALIAPLSPTPAEEQPAVTDAPEPEPTPELAGPAGRSSPTPRVSPPRPRPVRVGGHIKEPQKLRNVAPLYPDMARKARIQGVVILECTIEPNGRISDVKVLRGFRLLDAAAIDAVRQWIYSPTIVDGEPVPVIMTVTVNFRLE